MTKLREINPRIKKNVEKRSNGGCCALCSQYDKDVNGDIDYEIAHVYPNSVRDVNPGIDIAGEYSEDNLLVLDTVCHTIFDSCKLVFDPLGGYWVKKQEIHRIEIHTQQFSGISKENIYKRWNYERDKKGIHNDEIFRNKLKTAGYIFCR
jgi:hypothetical protein